MNAPSVSFGPFAFDPAAEALLRDGKPVAVGQRGIALLEELLAADGGVVSKAELIEAAWPGTIVEEGNLTVQIAALRKALGTRPDGQDWIVTVPRVGYRFLRLSGDGDAPRVPPISSTPLVAVLPFANLGADVEQDYFADGIVEDIITALSRFKSFAVISRNSSFSYKGRAVDARVVCKDLGVRYVVEGSIRKSGSRLRITAQLVDGASGAQLWAQNFDGALEDVFDFQDRITEGVATRVEPRIQSAEIERSRRERPDSIAVYDIYLRAMPKLVSETPEDNAEAYALLVRGLALEPNNAILLAYAAWALEHRTTMGWAALGPDDMATCLELARRGLQHAAGDPRVMAHCAMALIQTGKDYDLGMAVVVSAAEANPNDLFVAAAAGVATLHCGDIGEALGYFERAVGLSTGGPVVHFPLTGIAHVHMIRGDYEKALHFATRSLGNNSSFDATLWILIASNAHLGRMAEARRFLDQLRRAVPGVTIARIRAGQPSKDPTRIAAILEGLRRAGLPEA